MDEGEHVDQDENTNLVCIYALLAETLSYEKWTTFSIL